MSTAAEIPLRSRRVRTGAPVAVDSSSPPPGIGPDLARRNRPRPARRAARIELVVAELQRRARQHERQPLPPRSLRQVAADLGRRWTR